MKNKGFTLVETIIYVCLIGIVLTGFVSYALIISKLNIKNYVMTEINSNARTALQSISQKIKSANNINNPNQENSSSSLILEMFDGTLTIIEINDNILSIKNGSDEFTPIVSDKILISNLIFSNLSTSDNDQNVKISFTIDFKNSGISEYSYEQNFQTAVSLKK